MSTSKQILDKANEQREKEARQAQEDKIKRDEDRMKSLLAYFDTTTLTVGEVEQLLQQLIENIKRARLHKISPVNAEISAKGFKVFNAECTNTAITPK